MPSNKGCVEVESISESGVVNVTISESIRESFSRLCLFSSALFIHTIVAHHKAGKRTNTALCVKYVGLQGCIMTIAITRGINTNRTAI